MIKLNKVSLHCKCDTVKLSKGVPCILTLVVYLKWPTHRRYNPHLFNTVSKHSLNTSSVISYTTRSQSSGINPELHAPALSLGLRDIHHKWRA